MNQLQHKLSMVFTALFFLLSYGYIAFSARTSAPYFDSWRLYVEDQLFATRLLQHNEHLINFEAFVFFVDNSIFSGLGLFQLSTTFGFLAVSSALFAAQVRENLPNYSYLHALLIAMFLSGNQLTNITWQFQIGFVGCFFFGLISFWLLARAVKQSLFYMLPIGSLAFATLSSLSLSAGILLFPALAIYALILPINRSEKLFFFFSCTLIFTALFFAIDRSSSSSFHAQSVYRVIIFALAVLGSLFGASLRAFSYFQGTSRFVVLISIISGAIALSLALSMIAKCLLQKNLNRKTIAVHWAAPMTLWLALVSLAVGWGRAAFPLEEALTSRYVTISIFFIAGTLILIAKSSAIQKNWKSANAVFIAIMTLLGAAQFGRMAEAETLGRRLEGGESALVNSAWKAQDINFLYPPSMENSAKEIVPILKLRGISLFSQKRYRLLGTKLFEGALAFKNNPCRVQIREFSRTDKNTRLTGIEVNRIDSINPDTVVVANEYGRVLAVGIFYRSMPLQLSSAGDLTGFIVNVSTDVLPDEGKTRIFLANLSYQSFCYAAIF